MKLLKGIWKVISAVITVILAVILACNVYTIVMRVFFHQVNPSVFGYSNAVVISGSMADTIQVNDMVIIHREDDYTVGDVVTYQRGSVLITHRIVQETENGFITRGDANNTDDGEIFRESVVGKVVLVIPRVGVFIEWLQSPFGMLCMLAVLFVLVQLPSWLERLFRKDRGEEE